ncbi:hypothetical protein C1T31_09690 [Hanstruepera neustonica]|uniref:Trimeric autotransporter adhesin YadA-like head domain-containing protein n=1 Tax=Hanstruepera neustonica TaxID=1445657 RepID=A0A2K1DXN1_9FLAO|nr:hypothetical protein [Hanstruepera neustonica]PNQ72773.1 hypothetical protein C1T31_09690 [Hanstruepera neustonica]
MKIYKLLIFIFCFSVYFVNGQVGISTTNPNAQLDVRSSNQAAPANTDGILIPKVDDFPASNPTVAQDGMMVYATGSGVPAKGFYYWDNTTTTWIPFATGGVDDGDWVVVGANIERQNGNVYIGDTQGTNNDLYISNRLIDWDNTSYFLDPAGESRINEIGFDVGSLTDVSVRFDQQDTGLYSPASDQLAFAVNGIQRFRISETGVISFGDATGGFINYNFPLTRGSMGQVLTLTDNVGNLGWIDATSLGSDDHDFYEEGTTTSPDDINDDQYTFGNVAIGKNTANWPLEVQSSIGGRGLSIQMDGTANTTTYGLLSEITNSSNATHVGLYGRILGNGDGAHRAIETSTSGGGSGAHYGLYSSLSGAGTGEQFGVRTIISNSGNNNHYGAYNELTGVGSGDHFGTYNRVVSLGSSEKYGTYNSIGGNGSSPHYGTVNFVQGTGSGNKYGTYNTIRNDQGGTHYGVYSAILKPGSYAGYFVGNVSIGTNAGNNYILPPSRGTLNQIMQTDGTGNVSWVDPSTLNIPHSIDDLLDGKSDNDGTQDGSSIFLGIDAGANDDSSDNQNIGIGFQAFTDNTSGQLNTAMGYQALSSNLTGDNSVAIGARALFNLVNGRENTAIGSAAMSSQLSGAYNVAVGYQVFNQGISLNQNVGLGYQSGYNNGGTGNIFIGYQSAYNETGNNKLYIENSNSSSPLIYGEFDNDLLRINGTLDINNNYQFPTTDGAANQILQTDGAGNVSWVNNNPISLIPLFSNGSYGMANTTGQDLANMDTALEPTIYNATGNIEVKLVVRYSVINGANNLQLRAHDGTTETFPIVNTDTWTFAGTQNGGVATSEWKTWNAGTNAHEIHLFGWSAFFSSMNIVSAYLLVRSQ